MDVGCCRALVRPVVRYIFIFLCRKIAISHSLLFLTIQKSPRYYPAEDVKKSSKLAPHKVQQNPPRLRSSITPGTVLIILAGRFRGKRVVFLKALKSGLLLVTGPYKINGVPLRRVNQAYVIATSTKVDISGVKADKFDDAYFGRSKDPPKDAEEEFFEGDAPKAAIVSDERKADQQTVDGVLLKTIGSTPMLEGYLAAHFSLSSNDKPHLMKF